MPEKKNHAHGFCITIIMKKGEISNLFLTNLYFYKTLKYNYLYKYFLLI